MGLINKPYTFFPLTVIRSAEMNADFDVVYGEFNGNISDDNVSATAGIQFSKLQALPSAQILVGSAANVATPRAMSGDATISNTGVVTVNFGGGSGIPVGTITAFYDYNGLVTFDTNFWKYCDGTAIVKVGSPLNGQIAPDLSGRYIVGFGTDGGGDIGSAAWATLAVGNAGHQINIAHTHGGLNHSHSSPAHYHGLGTIAIAASGSHGHVWSSSTMGGAAGIPQINPNPPGAAATDSFANAVSTSTHVHANTDFTGLVGATGSGVSGDAAMTTGSTSPTTDSQLSAAQSIQPRSIRCRFIIRI